MKKLLPILLFCFSTVAFAQEDSYPQDVNKKHEVTINALTLIVSEWIDVSYEYLINEESSFGIDLQFGLDDNNDFDTYRTFSITPNYRRYFSNKYARGFFIEAFGMLHNYKDYYYNFDITTSSYTTKSQTDFSLGVSVGGKWVTKSGFVTEIFAGIGRNLLNNDNDFTEVAGRVGISLGYRF
ncbi:DUF3575 domain-containing protein [Pseudotenacibaculum sp. MALMAid0570]|uniref:DUF3575 domain-containing protein n=1 Tax=Pseudotenacibaculum sp. MALMAid0570 TaxID=3143938 RepID=UPI0032E00E87